MKATLHWPVESYGFVEVEHEVADIHEALALYKEGKAGDGLDKKTFDAFIERQLLGESNHIEDYLKMNAEQQGIVQCIKRGIKRLEAKNK